VGMECGTLIERKNCRRVSIIEQGLVILRINTTRHRGCTLDPENSCGDPLQTASSPKRQQHNTTSIDVSCLAVRSFLEFLL